MTRSAVSATRALAVLLAVLTIGTSLLVAVPTAQAPLSFNSPVLTPGQYTGTLTYVPGETLSFTLFATAGEIYDVAVVVGTTPLTWYDDQVIPPTGQLTLQYGISPTLPDGPYTVEVGTPTFMANYPLGRLRSRTFTVQEYEFTMEVDRRAYLGGDRVTITWSANRLKDGSLADDGDGQIWVYNETWMYSFVSPSPYRFTASAGSFSVDLPPITDANYEGIVEGWFNSTTAIRSQYARTDFLIERLSAIVDVDPGRFPNVFAPNGIVTTQVYTVATDNQAFPSVNDPREPGVSVVFTVWDVTNPTDVLHPEYGASGLVTDARGELTYVFKLQNAPDRSVWEVRMNATHPDGIWTWSAQDTFTVSAAAGITAILEADAIEYQAGSSAKATASVTGSAGGDLTYIFEVRDTTTTGCPTGAAGTLLGTRTVTTAQTTAEFTYAIDNNFQGQLCFSVVVDDGRGNRAADDVEVVVVFGWLVVNANPDRYSPNEVVTFTWELNSNRIQNPRYFYEVRDQRGVLVAADEAAGGSFSYQAPAVPSPWYDVTVTAVESGRAVKGTVQVRQVTGYTVDLLLDRPSYARGETMKIHYRLFALGGDPLPATFVLYFGLENMPSTTVSTTRAEGDLEYVVPDSANEGSQEFVFFEGRTGASASEVTTIRGTNAAWYVTLWDVPILIWVVIVAGILLTLMLWRRGALGGMGAPKAPGEAPAAPLKSEPVYAPPTSPMTVTCRSCGSPIEITTSKRPIEVMCPKCGNTEMVS